jgi:hypothetical protein
VADIAKMSGEEQSAAQRDKAAKSRDCLHAVCKKCVFTLAAFVDGNPENQQVLFNRLDLLRSKMGVGLFVWDVVISIFQNNPAIATRCPPDLFFQVSASERASERVGCRQMGSEGRVRRDQSSAKES